MKEENDVNVGGVPQVLHDDVLKINVEEGDALLVTLPETANQMPRDVQQAYQQNVSNAFQQAFEDKKLKVIVMPHGMQVEVFKSSLFEDKDNDASSEAE